MKDKFLIALGASAGGLSALKEFFDNTLPDGISYVITTHLYPHEKSLLAEILQRHSKIEVCDVEDGMKIETNIVYVMPENKVMAIANGRLKLTDRDLSIKVNYAIDIFFNSLAEDRIFNKIAIILSGMGNDGTRGIELLAQQGGYIIVQKPHSAAESSMPLNVIKDGYVNEILYPRQMPQAIIDHIALATDKQQKNKTTTHER
jgi:two-component system CheB/CheR fusion protein